MVITIIIVPVMNMIIAVAVLAELVYPHVLLTDTVGVNMIMADANVNLTMHVTVTQGLRHQPVRVMTDTIHVTATHTTVLVINTQKAA